MFAISFDMTVADIRQHYPKGISAAYAEIAKTLAPFGFERMQGSVYTTTNSDIGNLMLAVLALKSRSWFVVCARDVRGFKVETWSNFNPVIGVRRRGA